MDGSGELLEEFVASLKPDIEAEVYAYPAQEPLDYPALEDLVWGALSTSPSPARLLIAESFSGPVAIRLVARHPNLFLGLVLCATFVSSPQPWFKPLRSVLKLPLPIPPARSLMPLMMGRWATRNWTTREQLAMDRMRPAVARRRLANVLEIDETANLRRIRCPLLYLQATQDRLVPARNWKCILAGAPHAHRVRIPGPHFLLQAQPGESAGSIKQFFMRQCGSP